MPLARRVTALLMSVFLAHAMWVGSGFACGMPAMGDSSGAGAAVTAGEDVAGAEIAGMEMPGTANGHSDDAPAHDHPPCDLPWASDGCRSMTPCAPLATAAILEPLQSPGSAPSSVAPEVVLTPPSQVRPPELPPPRA